MRTGRRLYFNNERYFNALIETRCVTSYTRRVKTIAVTIGASHLMHTLERHSRDDHFYAVSLSIDVVERVDYGVLRRETIADEDALEFWLLTLEDWTHNRGSLKM